MTFGKRGRGGVSCCREFDFCERKGGMAIQNERGGEGDKLTMKKLRKVLTLREGGGKRGEAFPHGEKKEGLPPA